MRRQRPGARLFNLVSGDPTWRQLRNEDTLSTTFYLYDEISWWGITALDVVEALIAAGEDRVTLHINSPGGDIFEGIAILNSLRQHKPGVDVVVDGLAASAASFIAQAGATITMAPNSMMMIHDGRGIEIGTAVDMRAMADLLDKASDNIASVYADRSGREDAAWWRAQMQTVPDGVWYTAQEAVDGGLADKISDPGGDVANKWDLSVFGTLPTKVGAPAQRGLSSPGSDDAQEDEGWSMESLREAFVEAGRA